MTKFFSEYQKNRNIYEYSLDNNNSAVAETSLPGYDYRSWTAASATTQGGELRLKPPKKTIRIADGKCSIPPDELFFDDEISEMFKDL